MTYILPAISAASSIAGMAGQAGATNDALASREDARRVLGALKDPQLPDQNYSFLNYAGDYNPYAYADPEHAQYQTISEDPRVRQTEMDALNRLVEQGGAAGQATQEAAQYQALDEANQLAKGREGAVRQRMANAGQSGSGMDAILQAQSAQSAANRARGGTLDAVHMAALQKLANEQAIMGGAGSVRGQDMSVAGQNADIINRFNMFNTTADNAIAQKNTDVQNSAALRNLNTVQDISGRNTGITNAGVDKRNSDAKWVYGTKQDKATAQANALNGVASTQMQAGQVYNSLGQEGAKLATNIGKGIAEDGRTQDKDPYDSQASDDGSFSSRWLK